MFATAVRFEIRLPGVRSLKAKRRIVRPLLGDLRRVFDVSSAEVDHQDEWQRTGIGVALVSGSLSVIESLADEIGRYLEARADLEVLTVELSHLENN